VAHAGDPALAEATWAVVLAAGGSRRMGTPKQLLRHGGRTLVEAAVAAASAVLPGRVLVVLGSQRQLIRQTLSESGARIVSNEDWSGGLAGTIGVGVMALPAGCQAVLLMGCDQPGVGPEQLGRLLAAARPDGVVAARYAGTVGIPAIFPARLFAQLTRLTGDRGAKALLLAEGARVDVEMPEAARDLDEPGDARWLLSGAGEGTEN
jgi:molybdenum cofactor cytidylyltransferase